MIGHGLAYKRMTGLCYQTFISGPDFVAWPWSKFLEFACLAGVSLDSLNFPVQA